MKMALGGGEEASTETVSIYHFDAITLFAVTVAVENQNRDENMFLGGISFFLKKSR